jgi:hypothetical protein
MTILDLLKSMVQINDEVVQQYENAYKNNLPEKLKRIASNKADFYDTGKRIYRLLTVPEVLDTKKYLGIDLQTMHKIPIFDIGDNDFICYDFIEGKYHVFNIIDNTAFFVYLEIDELILELEK